MLPLAVLEMGLNLAPALGVAPFLRFSFDQINCIGGLGDPLVPYTAMVIFPDLESSFGCPVSSNGGLIRDLWSNHESIHDDTVSI
jgi:hypothetical protein